MRRGGVWALGMVLGVSALLAAALGPARAQEAPGAWGERAPLLEPRSEMSIAELNGRIYALGGYPAGRIPSDVVQVYDVATDTWSYGPPLPMPMHHTMAAVVDGRLFVIGGEFEGAGTGRPPVYLDTVYELDAANGAWLPRASMPTARSGGGSAVIDGKIYVAGGRPPRGHDFAVYDPRTDEWTVLPDVPTARNHLGVGAIDGKVYVAGGRFGGGVGSEMTDVLEIYDPTTNTWSRGAPLLEPRAGVAAVVARGCLYLIGGEGNENDPRGIFENNEAYDPATDTWHRLAPMPLPTHGLTGAAFLNDLIYIPGGAISWGVSEVTTKLQVYRPDRPCGPAPGARAGGS